MRETSVGKEEEKEDEKKTKYLNSVIVSLTENIIGGSRAG